MNWKPQCGFLHVLGVFNDFQSNDNTVTTEKPWYQVLISKHSCPLKESFLEEWLTPHLRGKKSSSELDILLCHQLRKLSKTNRVFQNTVANLKELPLAKFWGNLNNKKIIVILWNTLKSINSQICSNTRNGGGKTSICHNSRWVMWLIHTLKFGIEGENNVAYSPF